METLADRAARCLADHPAPALTVEELGARVRAEGAAVTPEVLLRTLESNPERFRVVDPCRGPWRRVWPATRASRADRVGAEGGAPHSRWVVATGAPCPERDPRARLRASVAHLGRTVDERSPTDLLRWVGMLCEMGAGRGRAPESPGRPAESLSRA